MHTCEISVLDFKILNMFSKVKGKNNVCFQCRLMQNMTNLLDHHTLRIYLVKYKKWHTGLQGLVYKIQVAFRGNCTSLSFSFVLSNPFTTKCLFSFCFFFQKLFLAFNQYNITSLRKHLTVPFTIINFYTTTNLCK